MTTTSSGTTESVSEMSESDKDRRLLSGTSSDGELHLPDDLFLDPNRPWSKLLPPYGGIINIKRDDDYVTRLLRRCVDGDEAADHRNFAWHYVWENCPYLPSWDIPVIFRGETDIDITAWNSPTEFINWFGWHCATAYIWANHLTAELQPREDVMNLLTSGRQREDVPDVVERQSKVIDRNKKGLRQVAITYLKGPLYWSKITMERVTYPTDGLKRMLKDIDETMDRKTIDWIDQAVTKRDKSAAARVQHIQDVIIPVRVRHCAVMFNRLGGGLDI